MKFKKYLEQLNKLAKERPELLNYEIIYSHDDEGNNYQKVENEPSVCYASDLTHYFIEEVHFGEDIKNQAEAEPNCICIN